MSLLKPREVRLLPRENQVRPAKSEKRRTAGYYVRIIVAIVVLGIAVNYGLHKYQHRNDNKPPVNAAVAVINSLKHSQNVKDMKTVASEYMDRQNYSAAESTIKKVAQQTGDVNDYLTLLNICAVNSVPDKQSCVNLAVSNIKPKIGDLSFYSAYTTAGELDDAGFKKEAVIFYQKAYDLYDTSTVDQYTKTKDQIKQRIDQLNA